MGLMPVLFRAIDEPAATRFDYWRQVIGDQLAPMEIRLDDGPDARDEFRTGALGAIQVTESSTGPGEVCRTARHIGSEDPGLYQLFVPTAGTVLGEQGGRRISVGPGDAALIDLSRPVRCVHQARRAVQVTFPHAITPLRRAELDRVTGTLIPDGEGTGALVASLVTQLPQHLGDPGGAVAARLGTVVLDVLSTAFAARLHLSSRVPPGSRRGALLTRIYGFIDGRLGDPALTPASVAAAQHISVRYLHRLFEGEEHSVAGLIRQRRLDRVRRDLLDPALAGSAVAALAARWGFTSPAHFSRLFSGTYGLPPAEFRRAFGPPGP